MNAQRSTWSAEKDKLRKTEFARKKNTARKAARPEGKLALVRIADLDRSPARGVRVKLDEEAVARYADAEEGGAELPPVQVFEGGGRHFLADGEHRVEARLRTHSGCVRARVVACCSEAEARQAAKLHAAGANDDHGLPRSLEDKRLAIRSVLAMPEFATASNRAVGRACNVKHGTVEKIRREMTVAGELTGDAAVGGDGRRRVKCLLNYRAGVTMMPDGREVRTEEALAEVRRNPAAFHADDPVRKLVEGTATPTPEGGCAATPEPKRAGFTYQVCDHLGHIIPDDLLGVWEGGRELRREFLTAMNAGSVAVHDALGKSWAVKLPALYEDLKGWLLAAGKAVEASMPYCVCACRYRGQTGCPACGQKGWLSKGEYDQQFPAVKDETPAGKGGRSATSAA